MTDDELYEALKIWLDKNWGKRNAFYNHAIARLIRRKLESSGHFKQAPRGNPSAGGKQKAENKKKDREGED